MSWFKFFKKSRASASTAGSASDSGEGMNNFTPRAQQALALARKEADRFNHSFVGTEHLLLGIIRLGQGVAFNVLKKLGIDLETLRTEVEKQIGTGPDQRLLGNIPYTPRVKKVLALAAKESRALNHTYVGTEHVLLGLLQEGDGVAARVLMNLDVDIEQTRQEILKELDPNFATDPDRPSIPISTKPENPKPSMNLPGRSSVQSIGAIDTTKRYDIYCAEKNHEVVVYRNARLKDVKNLFEREAIGFSGRFVEIEQADGSTIFVAQYSIIKFCEPGVTPGSEPLPGPPA